MHHSSVFSTPCLRGEDIANSGRCFPGAGVHGGSVRLCRYRSGVAGKTRRGVRASWGILHSVRRGLRVREDQTIPPNDSSSEKNGTRPTFVCRSLAYSFIRTSHTCTRVGSLPDVDDDNAAPKQMRQHTLIVYVCLFAHMIYTTNGGYALHFQRAARLNKDLRS